MKALGTAARKVLNPGGGNYENVRLETIDHFIDHFLQTANHVYIPRPAYDHHFLIKSAKYYNSQVKQYAKLLKISIDCPNIMLTDHWFVKITQLAAQKQTFYLERKPAS